jgi:hypothetical protein
LSSFAHIGQRTRETSACCVTLRTARERKGELITVATDHNPQNGADGTVWPGPGDGKLTVNPLPATNPHDRVRQRQLADEARAAHARGSEGDSLAEQRAAHGVVPR